MFGDAYRGRSVLLTGHTGFKGSWLALWLKTLGAKVTGLAIGPTTSPSHWDLLGLDLSDTRVDIRDAQAVAEVMRASVPEIVFHLAAQPLVRKSYREPLETWSTNVMGAANLLEACRQQPSVRAIVVITTDKCYENLEWEWGYRETDRLGGRDPYSASKASVELVVASYRDAFFGQSSAALLATARAGNVIGGGDWSEDRLVPDLVRAIASRSPLVVRSPSATRPWQHVLEPLSGYLLLGQKLIEGRREFAQAWNFGPGAESNRPVAEVLARLKTAWPSLEWRTAADSHLHEARSLLLDSAKAHSRLGWRPTWTLEQGLAVTAAWYRALLETGAVITEQQLQSYVTSAANEGLTWVS